MGGADAFRRGRALAREQQLYLEQDPADCHRRLEQAVYRTHAGRATRRCSDEPDSVGTHAWTRPLRLFEGRVARLPTQRASQIAELLPRRWQPSRNNHD